jgi:hypothetical protein
MLALLAPGAMLATGDAYTPSCGGQDDSVRRVEVLCELSLVQPGKVLPAAMLLQQRQLSGLQSPYSGMKPSQFKDRLV